MAILDKFKVLHLIRSNLNQLFASLHAHCSFSCMLVEYCLAFLLVASVPSNCYLVGEILFGSANKMKAKLVPFVDQ